MEENSENKKVSGFVPENSPGANPTQKMNVLSVDVLCFVWFGFVGLGWVQSEDKVLRSAIMLSYISFDQFNPITVHFFQHGPSFHSDPLSAIRMELDLDLYLFPLLIGGKVGLAYHLVFEESVGVKRVHM